MKSVKNALRSFRRTILLFGVVSLVLAIVAVVSQTRSHLNLNQRVFAGGNGNSTLAAGRTIRAVPNTGTPGGEVTVLIEVDSQGDEVAASLTINFDPTVLSNPVVSLGSDVPMDTVLTLNPNQVGSGKIGILFDSANSFVLSPPARRALAVKFNIAPNAPSGPTLISFDNAPTPRSTSNPLGELLPTSYQNGSVTISAAPRFTVSGKVTTPTGLGLRNATVIILDSNNVRRTTTTSSFGLYNFSDVQSGQSYTVSVSSKRYRFAARVVSVSSDLSNIDFVGLE